MTAGRDEAQAIFEEARDLVLRGFDPQCGQCGARLAVDSFNGMHYCPTRETCRKSGHYLTQDECIRLVCGELRDNVRHAVRGAR